MSSHSKYVFTYILNFLSAISFLVTQAGAAIYIARVGTLEEVGHFTLIFAIFAPINLLAGMAFVNLMASGNPAFQNVHLLITARLMISVPLTILTIAALYFLGNINIIIPSLFIGMARIIDIVGEILQSKNRLDENYFSLLYSGITNIVTFIVSIFLLTSLDAFNLVSTVALSFMAASAASTAVDAFSAKGLWHRLQLHDLISGSFALVKTNWARGAASFGNSLAANLPRYILHYFVSPAAQGAFSIVVSLSRAGFILIHAIILPQLKIIVEKISNNIKENIKIFFIYFIGLSIFTVFLTILTIFILLHFFSLYQIISKLENEISQNEYISLSFLAFFLFLRFSLWTIASVTISMPNQIYIVIVNNICIAVSCLIFVPHFGIIGAAYSEIFGHAVMLMMIYWILISRGIERDKRSPNDVLIYDDIVVKKTSAPNQMALKYNLVAAAVAPCGARGPKAWVASDKAVYIEKLNISITIKDLLISYSKEKNKINIERIFENCGSALFAIHQIEHPDSTNWEPPQFIKTTMCSELNKIEKSALPPDDKYYYGLLHGDYSINNVVIESNNGQMTLCILDPCPNGGSTHGLMERGPIYIDIGLFVAGLWGQLPLKNAIFLRHQTCEILISCFIRGYERSSGLKLNQHLVEVFAKSMVGAQFESRFGMLGSIRTLALLTIRKIRRQISLWA